MYGSPPKLAWLANRLHVESSLLQPANASNVSPTLTANGSGLSRRNVPADHCCTVREKPELAPDVMVILPSVNVAEPGGAVAAAMSEFWPDPARHVNDILKLAGTSVQPAS